MDGICVVNVQTEAYRRGDSYFYGKSIRVVKRLTSYDLLGMLEDECDTVGIQEGLENILNLGSVEDGKYFLVMTNVSKDWETGYIDGWDLKLVPYTYDNP